MSLTTNQREKQLEKDLRARSNAGTMVIVIITLTVLSLVIIRAVVSDFKELSDHKSKQIRELQKVMHGCDRCYEEMHGRKK